MTRRLLLPLVAAVWLVWFALRAVRFMLNVALSLVSALGEWLSCGDWCWRRSWRSLRGGW